jgi:hypothetical protein
MFWASGFSTLCASNNQVPERGRTDGREKRGSILVAVSPSGHSSKRLLARCEKLDLLGTTLPWSRPESIAIIASKSGSFWPFRGVRTPTKAALSAAATALLDSGRGGMRACPRIARSKGACGLPLVGFSTPRSVGRGAGRCISRR